MSSRPRSAISKKGASVSKVNRDRPYDSGQRPKARGGAEPPPKSRRELRMMSEWPPTSHRSSTSLAWDSTSVANFSGGTLRDVCREFLAEHYPNFEPQNDWELDTVFFGNFRGPESEIREWLDCQMKIVLAAYRDISSNPEDVARLKEAISVRAGQMLDCPGSVTGLKPKPGIPTPNVFIRPIPDSQYSIRLFPGNIYQREYCLDFVRTSTSKPVDTPPGFEVWVSPQSTTSWLGFSAPMRRLQSLEKSFGLAGMGNGAALAPGDEKFLLQDGQSYVLKRPGHKNLRFRVPIRTDGSVAPVADEDVVDLPETVIVPRTA